MAQYWASEKALIVVQLPFIWRHYADPTLALLLICIISLTAGVTRAQRKALFDK